MRRLHGLRLDFFFFEKRVPAYGLNCLNYIIYEKYVTNNSNTHGKIPLNKKSIRYVKVVQTRLSFTVGPTLKTFNFLNLE